MITAKLACSHSDGYELIITADVLGFRGGTSICRFSQDEDIRKLFLKICTKINAPCVFTIIDDLITQYRDKAKNEKQTSWEWRYNGSISALEYLKEKLKDLSEAENG